MYLWPPTATSPPLIYPVKRGQSLETTLTESTYPTTKPTSAYEHGNPKPTIGGSFGGFLGLVIGLGVLSIIAGLAAWFVWRRNKNKGGLGGSGFPKGPGFFRKKNKGWMQTQSYTDGDGDDDDDGIRLNQPEHHAYPAHANQSTASVGIPSRGRPYDDPFNAQSLDNLQRETSAQIDKGPEYHPVNTTNVDHPQHQPQPQPRQSLPSESPTSPTFAGGTKFKESL